MRGRVECLHCGGTIVWREGGWRLLTTGEALCEANKQQHRHHIKPA